MSEPKVVHEWEHGHASYRVWDDADGIAGLEIVRAGVEDPHRAAVRELARLARERDVLAKKVECLEARETFCADCFDKVAHRGCWRCKWQALARERDELAHQIRLLLPVISKHVNTRGIRAALKEAGT